MLQERLTLGKYKPRAWAVALLLDAYSRQDAEGRRFASVFHAKIAAETGLDVSTVRRALRELSSGDAPLYERRGTTGQLRKLRARNGWELDTRGVAYYWIENLEAYLVARDTARAGNLLAFEQRRGEDHGDRVRLQAAMLTGQIDQSTYEAQVAQLDAKARGRLPKHATKRKALMRCLTGPQLERFADALVRGAEIDFKAREALGTKGVREFHALHQHVFGNGGEIGACSPCQDALGVAVRQLPEMVRFLEAPARRGSEVARCGCGEWVVRGSSDPAMQLWGWLRGEHPDHQCLHEQNRLMKLRNGGHR